MANETTTNTLTEMIPVIVGNALLELEEGNIMEPLVTVVDFSGPGIIHQTPFLQMLVAEAGDDLTAQAVDSGSSYEVSPSAATSGVHASYVLLKDIAAMASVGDTASMIGQLIGNSIITRQDKDLVALFTSFATNQGAVGLTYITPADAYDAYGALRANYAKGEFNLVLHPTQMWSTNGVSGWYDGSTTADLSTYGFGTVGEDFNKNGISGRALGFNLYADGNITMATSAGSGCAFAREAIKLVVKRGFGVETQRSPEECGSTIVGSKIWGEAILRRTAGNRMQFHA
jgi:hypothetical protein